MNENQYNAVQTLRTKGNGSYFPLDLMTDEELVNALRCGDSNTPTENVALREVILERMAR